MTAEDHDAGLVEEVEFERPTVAEVHEVLRAHRSLLAHFASYPPMDSGNGKSPVFPDNLIRVFNKQCPGGVCCSTFSASDKLEAGVNVSGYIGVLLRPASGRSIVAVAPGDVGSQYVNGRREFSMPPGPVTRADLERSIRDRSEGDWNEWIVDDYEPIGNITLGVGAAYGKGTLSPEQLSDIFGYPVYRFEDGQLVRLLGDTWIRADHGDLYP
jgi:hypothetical protein